MLQIGNITFIFKEELYNVITRIFNNIIQNKVNEYKL